MTSPSQQAPSRNGLASAMWRSTTPAASGAAAGEGLGAGPGEGMLHAYAVLRAGAPLPAVEGIEDGLLPFAVSHGARALVVSRVRACGPTQLAQRHRAHHALCRALAFRSLPLAFGIGFSGGGALRQWFGARARRLAATLDRAEGCAESRVLVRKDPGRLDAYLDRAELGVAALRATTGRAEPGRRRMLERCLAEARAAARARLRDRAAALLRDELAPARAVIGPRAADGAEGMAVLLPEPAVAALRRRLAAHAKVLADGGIEVALTGPWPPYGFARETLGGADV